MLSIFLASSNSSYADEKEIFGAWKSTKFDPVSRRQKTIGVMIEKDKVTDTHFSTDAVFEEKDGRIIILSAGERRRVYICKIIDKNTIELSNNSYMGVRFKRTTKDEILPLLRK